MHIDIVYTVTIRYKIHMQNLIFKFEFKLCVIHPKMKIYTLSAYRGLIQYIMDSFGSNDLWTTFLCLHFLHLFRLHFLIQFAKSPGQRSKNDGWIFCRCVPHMIWPTNDANIKLPETIQKSLAHCTSYIRVNMIPYLSKPNIKRGSGYYTICSKKFRERSKNGVDWEARSSGEGVLGAAETRYSSTWFSFICIVSMHREFSSNFWSAFF